MECPKCIGRLQEVKIGKKNVIVIDRCFACGGVWFDKNELELVINKEIWDTVEFDVEEIPPEDEKLKKEIDLDKKGIVCPRCKNNRKMLKGSSKRNPKVTIDFCESCGGIWLDAGEYNKVSARSPAEAKTEKIIDFFRLHFPRIFRDNI